MARSFPAFLTSWIPQHGPSPMRLRPPARGWPSQLDACCKGGAPTRLRSLRLCPFGSIRTQAMPALPRRQQPSQVVLDALATRRSAVPTRHWRGGPRVWLKQTRRCWTPQLGRSTCTVAPLGPPGWRAIALDIQLQLNPACTDWILRTHAVLLKP